MIRLEPTAGLCNRLRSIDASISLAKDLNQQLHINWRLNSDCNASFSDLFEIPKGINSLNEEHWRVSRVLIEKLKIGLHHLGWQLYFESKKAHNINKENKTIWAKVNTAADIYIRTCHGFYPTPKPVNRFIPKDFLLQKIRTFKNIHAIGVHIRRTDHSQATTKSSNEAFIKRMKEEIRLHPDCQFFLATDEPEVEVLFKEEFGGRIEVHKKRSLDRNNPIAIEDAVIDLFSLANCQKIIGSAASSYSEFAASIHGIDIELAL